MRRDDVDQNGVPWVQLYDPRLWARARGRLRYVAPRRPRVNWTVLVFCLLVLAWFVARAISLRRLP